MTIKTETNIKPFMVGNKACPNIRVVPHVGLEVLVCRRSQKQGGNVYRLIPLDLIAKQIKNPLD